MKKWLLGILLLAAPLFADTTTSRMGLVKPDESSTGWGPKVRANYDIIDSSVALLSGPNLFTSSQTFTALTGMTTVHATQVIVDSDTYTGNYRLYVDGQGLIGTALVVGEAGNLGAPYVSFINPNVGGSAAGVFHSGTLNSNILIKSAGDAFIGGIADGEMKGVNAGRIIASENWADQSGTLYQAPSDNPINPDEANYTSAFEYSVLVGTVSNLANSKVVILSSTAYTYSLAVGTAPTIGNNYHLTVSTMGRTGINGTLAVCNPTGGDCSTFSSPDAFAGVYTSTISAKRFIGRDTNLPFGSSQYPVFVGLNSGFYYAPTGASVRPPVAIGYSALLNYPGTFQAGNIFGSEVAIGYAALFNLNRGIQNVAIGDNAGPSITDGSWNSFIGARAGYGPNMFTPSPVVVSTNSIYIGAYTGPTSSMTQLTNAVAIGVHGRVNQSDSLVFGIPAHNPDSVTDANPFSVGIGTDTPKETLHVVGDIRVQSGALQLHSETAANIRATTPGIVGAQYYCSDCTTVPVCISTGTAQFQWSLITNRASACQ